MSSLRPASALRPKSAKPSHSSIHTRNVEATKLPDSRIGVGLLQRGSAVIVHEVFASSPLEGLVWPGEIVKLKSMDHDHTLAANRPLRPSSACRTLSAKALSEHCWQSSKLELIVETPAAISNAKSTWLFCEAASELGITVERDPESGRARIQSLVPGSVAATTVDRDSLSNGDIIVAIGVEGTLSGVSNHKEAMSKLNGAVGAIELRVVRPSGWPAIQRPERAVRAPERSTHSWETTSHPRPPPYCSHTSGSSLESLIGAPLEDGYEGRYEDFIEVDTHCI